MKRRGKAGGSSGKRKVRVGLKIQKASTAHSAEEFDRLKRERDEALEQQAATAEVLRVIRRSPTDVQPVFDMIAESAARLCAAEFCFVYRFDGELLHFVAHHSVTPEVLEINRRAYPQPPSRRSVAARAILEQNVVQIPDVKADPDYALGALAAVCGYRSAIGIPILRDGLPIGSIAIVRAQTGLFPKSQVELLKTFADQAVIAIENVRLFNETKEALEQQTATSEVLKVISSSAGELQPVFDTMLAKATELCEASYGALWLRDGEGYRFVALFGDLPKEYEEHRRNKTLIRVRPEVPLARIAVTRQPMQVADLRTDPAYLAGDPLPVSAADVGGIRTLLVVPMFKEGELIGAIAIYRKEVRPFTDKQVGLVSNFASQAVIAIENTRLLSELRESLEQQTATSEVLQVISASPGQLEPVFKAMLGNAVRTCGAKFGIMYLSEGDGFRTVAMHDVPRPFAEKRQREPFFRPSAGSPMDRIVRTRQVAHISDITTVQGYVEGDRPLMDLAELGGARTVAGMPMLKKNELVGAIIIYRQEVRPFTEKQIDLVKNFAAQAVIAIENTRLLNELRQRTDDLSESLEHLRTTQDRLVQTQKLASLGQLTAGIAHEMKNPLNFVNNFSAVSSELIDELQETLKGLPVADKARAEINELTDTLRDNLDKVVRHGKRADAIVKNMLLHSRESSGEHRPVDINALVEESLNLAWHGTRAEKQGFEIKLKQSFDPAAGEADVFPQDITRALLNLISNGFYAATKRRAATNSTNYEPTLAASTKSLGDRVEIRIRDNGTGILPDVKEKMFDPFFTTKPTGEGTGLGLSISHDIIVKQHAGSIEVDTQLGEFTEIRIILPRTAVFL